MKGESIVVSSHVGRDILHSAQLFRTVEAAVWEYVVNSLQYVDPGVTPNVVVVLDQRRRQIVISDNGRGMDADGLRHFFIMHAENLERRQGVPGRGKFGTGKSAAFGIGDTLAVNTVRDGVRNTVELHREDIASSDGSHVPTRWVVQNQASTDANGTVITISGVQERRMHNESMIRTFERHLAFWRATGPRVVVGSHVCTPWEPDVVKAVSFTASGQLADILGPAVLNVKVARRPLDEGARGVAVTAGPGNLVALEASGVDSKEFGNYLFGEIDVPALETPAFEGKVVAFDTTRSLTLNYDHPTAMAVAAFIGSSLETVRKGLVDENRKARQEAETQRLESAADEIAEVLNQDLKEVAQRFEEMRNIRKRSATTARSGEAEGEGVDYVEGGDEPGLLDRLEPRDRTDAPITPSGGEDPGEKHGKADPQGPDVVEKTGTEGRKRSKSGGLTVRFRNLGVDEERSLYDFELKQILINLDHPAVAAAKGLGGVDDPVFRRLAYEIAFTQYALGMASEIYKRDPAIAADDLLFEVRDALRRITARAAVLYSST